MKNKYLEQYVEFHMSSVSGFCPVETFHVLDHVDSMLISQDKRVMEIGVHHGQLFIALNQLATSESYAVDVFDNQELNIDNSGGGDYHKFTNNLMDHDPKHSGKNVKVICGDSLSAETFSQVSSCDYISVDGGHTPNHVVSDLQTAARLVKPTGVVILDDYFNHWWPSVTEGLVKYLQMTPVLVPFCTSKNKMWLCNLSYHAQYLSHMQTIANFGKTNTIFFGYKLLDLW